VTRHLSDDIYRLGRGNFSGLMTTHAIGHGQQVSRHEQAVLIAGSHLAHQGG
jgi:hypothetical protein